ncbi:MAG: serine hydrolase domain-containing protein [Verrucomicrobiota bacterium]
MKSILSAAAGLLIATSVIAEEVRVWTSSANGRQFRGSLVEVEGDKISIRREADNVVFQVDKSALIQADLDWIRENSAVGESLDLSELIAGIPASTGVPAAGVLLIDGKTRGFGVAGIRKAGAEVKAELGDKWHLGSCTKSMTATLAGVLVEEGEITWETTIGDTIGKQLEILDAYQSVTLGMLLANRGGVPGATPNSVFEGIDVSVSVEDLSDRDILEQRAKFVEAALNLPPTSEPGTQYQYSNAGFVVAGNMLESVTRTPWEKLIEEKIFRPLGMENSGFGNSARGDRDDPSQPWPHKDNATPHPPGSSDDNSWVLGPAGTVHCSLQDVAAYIAMHASHQLGPVLKKKETFEYLQTELPNNQNYARGWIVANVGWANGKAVSHDGSNTMNYCSIWIAPNRNAAVAAFSNSGESGQAACQNAIQLVVGKYLE